MEKGSFDVKVGKILSACIISFVLIFTSGCDQGSDIGKLTDDFEVHFIDVGQGDSALILCGGKSMLIDGGRPNVSDVIYTYLKKQNVKQLDYIVCSHADDDHVGGLSAPLSTMRVKNVLAPETPSDTKSYVNIIEKTREQGISIQHPKHGESMEFANSVIEFYGPITEDEDDRNNSSVVMKVIYGDTSFLFTGDAGRKEETEMLNENYNLSATVLKVGHHGSESSSTYPFLKAVAPKYAVISVGENSYGHPSEKVLSKLHDAETEVYRTDLHGDIIVKSDGKNLNFTTAKSVKKQISSNESGLNYENYIGNMNTKKFHREDCGSVKSMKDENKIRINRREAEEKEYKACEVCKP